MAAAALVQPALFRCPACLKLLSATWGTADDARLRCPTCKGEFLRKNGITVPEPQTSRPEAPAVTPAPEPSIFFKYSGRLAFLAGCYALGTWIGLSLKGPEFLGYYLVVFFLVYLVSLIVSLVRTEHMYALWFGLLIFEGIGLTRIITGVQQGMHKFGLLGVMMILGGIVFLATRVAREPGGCSVGGCSGGSGFWSS